MPIVYIENEWNNRLRLTQNESRWQLTGLTGLNPPPANIVTSVIPGFDGTRFNLGRLEERNVVITLALTGNAETGRMLLNNVILPKRYIKVLYRNNTLNVYIEGYVDTFEYDVFEQGIIAQASIICPSPYWIDVNDSDTNIKRIVDLFEFPFSIPEEGIAFSEITASASNSVINSGTVQTGIMITIEADYDVTNPTITNTTTHEHMTIDMDMKKGDQIIINTVQGNKYVEKYADDTETNIINSLTMDSNWINVIPGENLFMAEAESGEIHMRTKITLQNRYGGV